MLPSTISIHSDEKPPSSYIENIPYTPIPRHPYRGLSAFREQDAPFFFGREVFADQLIERVRGKPLVAVIGPSGSGKSSLIFAGLFPRLYQEGSWCIAPFRPRDRPSAP